MDYLSQFTTTSSLAKTYCNRFNVPHLAEGPNLAIALFGCTFFFAAQAASHYLSPKLFPKHFKNFSKRTRHDWDMHFTGWIHALISTPLAIYLINNPSRQLIVDPIFGYAPLEGAAMAFSGGYFLYDLIVSLLYVKTHGIPFVIHAGSCCFIFFKAFTPFLNGLFPMFLVWELSTIFLHPHWWLDKLNMTGSILQLVNGAALMAAFFGARICYGGLMTYRLWNLLESPRITPFMRWGFRSANLALDMLNWSWFRLMVISLNNRLKARKDGTAGNGEPKFEKRGGTTKGKGEKSE